MTPRATVATWPSLVLAAAATALLVQPADPRVAIRVPDGAPIIARALDVWTEHHAPGMPIDIVVAASDLVLAGPFELLVPDIDAAAAAEVATRPGDYFASYHDFPATADYLAQLQRQFPERVSLHTIGTSLEGRPILAVRIGAATATRTQLITGTQHAREWIAAATSVCVADRLARDYATDAAVREHVDRTTTWIVPVVNPDGYQYSWTSSRYWRKNRRAGHGVDLNRNWAIAFGGPGSSSNKRSDIYRGEHAFSEPETAAVRDLAARERPGTTIDFHSYGQLVLYPWNYTKERAADHERLTSLGARVVTAVQKQHGVKYTLMNGTDLYPAAGTAQDFMYGAHGALAYTIELRPKGGSGFVLPAEQIRPTCDEGLAAVLTIGR